MISGESALEHVHNGWVELLGKILGAVLLLLFVFDLPFEFSATEIVQFYCFLILERDPIVELAND